MNHNLVSVKKITLFLLVLLFSLSRVFSAETIFKIKVIDKETKQPIPNAYVKIILMSRGENKQVGKTAIYYPILGTGVTLFSEDPETINTLNSLTFYVCYELSGYTDTNGICELRSSGGIDFRDIDKVPYPDYFGHWKYPDKREQTPVGFYVCVIARGYIPTRRYEVNLPFIDGTDKFTVTQKQFNQSIYIDSKGCILTFSGDEYIEETSVQFPPGALEEGEKFWIGATKGDSTPKAFNMFSYFWQTLPAIAIISQNGKVTEFKKEVTLKWKIRRPAGLPAGRELTLVRIYPDKPFDEPLGICKVEDDAHTIYAKVKTPGIYILADHNESKRLWKEVFKK